MTPSPAEDQARCAPSLIGIGWRVPVALGLALFVVMGVWLWVAWRSA